MSIATPNSTPEATPESDPWIGRVVDGRYRIEEFLGEGGMGSVYVAEHLKLRKRVALKIIHPEFAGDGEVAARFAREAMASAQLEHPHVASAQDFGSLKEGGAYLVMQLVRGDSLAKILEDGGAMPWPEVCEIGAQIADALAAAHNIEIVHRDLKPDNVLLEPRDDGSSLAKVLDFGIARIATDGQKNIEGAAPGKALTRAGTVMGTPGYMAPEQAMGDAVDHRVDLYALGVCLWEMLVGRGLYEGNDLTAIVTQQLTQTPTSVDVAAEDDSIPEELEELVAALLSRKPDDRPGSAGVVRDMLRQLVLRASITGIRPALPTTSGLGMAPTGLAPAVTPALLTDGQDGAPNSGGRTPTAALPAATTSVPPKVLALGCTGAIAMLAALVVGISAFTGGDESDGSKKPPPVREQPRPGILEEFLSPASATPVTPEVRENIDRMLTGSGVRQRRRAARWLTGHEPESEVPEWARVTAELVGTRDCRAKMPLLARIVDLDAEEALPVVERMHRSPRNQCGPFFARTDCFACMRDELREAVDELGGDPDEAPGGD